MSRNCTETKQRFEPTPMHVVRHTACLDNAFYPELSDRWVSWFPVNSSLISWPWPRSAARRHFLRHVEQEPPVAVVHATHQPAQLVQKTSLFAMAAPDDIVGAFALRKVGELWWLFAVVEELIERYFESASHLFQCLDSRNGMAIFDAGNIATEEPGALLDITLRKFLFFAQCAESITDNHIAMIP